MGESQCPVCHHITTGFEQQDFEVREATLDALRARVESLERALREIADLGDVNSDEGPTIARRALLPGDKQ